MFRNLDVKILAPLTGMATLFEYSYVFDGGKKVTGTFTGNQNGIFVENVTDVTMSFDSGLPVMGPIYVMQWDYSTHVWFNGATVSFDANYNQFAFINSDYVNGNYFFDTYFFIRAGEADFTQAGAFYRRPGPVMAWVGSDFVAPERWSLTPVVPDGGITILLLGGVMTGLAAWRRKMN